MRLKPHGRHGASGAESVQIQLSVVSCVDGIGAMEVKEAVLCDQEQANWHFWNSSSNCVGDSSKWKHMKNNKQARVITHKQRLDLRSNLNEF